MIKANVQVRLIANPELEMTVRAVIENKVVCDYIADNQLQEWVGEVSELEEVPELELFPVKITPALAGTEVKNWLDFKRVKPIKRQAYAAYVATLIQSVAYGDIEISKDFRITHNLNVPLLNTEGKVAYSKMEYAARVSAQALSEALRDAGNDSEISNSIAYGSALTNLPVAIIRTLDTSDLSVIAALSVFFS